MGAGPGAGALGLVNEATKWVVSGAAFVFLVARRDLRVSWGLMGACLTAGLAKALKRYLNQKRPDAAWKADPGMPSSHATALAFLATYASGGCLAFVGAPALAWGGCAATMACAAFLTWLRVATGLHTAEQVVAGFALGAATSAAWFEAGRRWVFAQDGAGMAAVHMLCALAVLVFGVKTLKRWRDDSVQYMHIHNLERGGGGPDERAGSE